MGTLFGLEVESGRGNLWKICPSCLANHQGSYSHEMGSMSLISYSRYLFVRQSGLRSAPRIASSKTWSRAPAPIVRTTVELSHQLVWVRNYAEASEISDLDAYWASLDQCVSDLKDHLIKHLTLRSGAALDELQVELEGDNFPLREVASISKKDPKRIIVECSSFPQATKTIFSAIANSGM